MDEDMAIEAVDLDELEASAMCSCQAADDNPY